MTRVIIFWRQKSPRVISHPTSFQGPDVLPLLEDYERRQEEEWYAHLQPIVNLSDSDLELTQHFPIHSSPMYPVKDARTVSRSAEKPKKSNRGYVECCNSKTAPYGHRNDQLGDFLAFHCTSCDTWFCGECYERANPIRTASEQCVTPGCQVFSETQIEVKEWFPPKITVTLMTKEPKQRAAPYPAPRVEQPPPPVVTTTPTPTPIVPPLELKKSIDDITTLFSSIEQQLVESRKAAEEWKAKYDELKKKLKQLSE